MGGEDKVENACYLILTRQRQSSFVSLSCDTVISYDSAVLMIAAMQAEGASADLHTFVGAGHVPWGDLGADEGSASMLGFLALNLDLENAECPSS